MITLIFDFDVFDSRIFVFDYDTYSILILHWFLDLDYSIFDYILSMILILILG